MNCCRLTVHTNKQSTPLSFLGKEDFIKPGFPFSYEAGIQKGPGLLAEINLGNFKRVTKRHENMLKKRNVLSSTDILTEMFENSLHSFLIVC